MNNQVNGINSSNKEELEQVLIDCFNDIRVTAKTLFPEMFSSPFSILHDQIFDLINSGKKKIAIAAPRGLGKTTIAKTLVMRAILFRAVNFVVYASCTSTSAVMQTENIKRELRSNKTVRKLFGKIEQADYDTGEKEEFSKKAWTAFGDILVLPRGRGQQVRGLNFNNHRPQLIVVDDLEDKKELKNPQIRKDIKDWFHSDLLKSVNRYEEDYTIIYIDTVKHEDSLLSELLESDEWASIRLSICDETFKSFVPHLMSDEEVLAEFKAHDERGQSDVFYMEFMNLPVAAQDAVFKSEYFKRYSETDAEFIEELKQGEIETVILVDPAKTTKLTSDDSAIVVVGVNSQKNKVYLRDIVHGRFHPDQIYDHTLNLAQFYGVRVIGLEMNSLNEFISYPFKNEMHRRGLNYEIVDLKPRKPSAEYNDLNYGKEGRVSMLAPLYRRGQVFHNETIAPIIESQLMSFPRAKKWDVMDAFAYINQLLDMGNRYFLPRLESEEAIEDEFAQLEQYDEPLLTEDWRIL